STDNITDDITPTFIGTAKPGVIVELLANGLVVGSGTADAQGNWNVTSSQRANGTYNFTARAKNLAGSTSAQSAALSVTINATQIPNLTVTSLTLINA